MGEGARVQVPGITARLREWVDGEAVARAMTASVPEIKSRVLRSMASFVASNAPETSDVTARLHAATDGRYRIDGESKLRRDGPERIVNDGEYLWQFAGNRIYRWSAEPLHEGIRSLLHPELILNSHSSHADGTIAVGDRRGTRLRVELSHLESVTSPLSRSPVLADGAEIVIDGSIGVAMRIIWLFRGMSLLRLELSDITESVDSGVFEVQLPPGARVITTKNPLVTVPPEKAAASAFRFVADLSSWVVKNRRAKH